MCRKLHTVFIVIIVSISVGTCLQPSCNYPLNFPYPYQYPYPGYYPVVFPNPYYRPPNQNKVSSQPVNGQSNQKSQQPVYQNYFANIPTEIIDVGVVPNGNPQSRNFKIPTEVIDLNTTPVSEPMAQITIHPTASSDRQEGIDRTDSVGNQQTQNNVQKLQYIPRKIIRTFTTQSKPIEAIITRTFGRGKPEVHVKYGNGDGYGIVKQDTTTSEAPTTTIETETTTIDENPQPVGQWPLSLF